MKAYISSIFFFVILSVTSNLSAQNDSIIALPDVEIETPEGEIVSTNTIKHDGPIYVSFWATWCKPCIQELIIIDENYVDWQEETDVKVIAVSIDEERTAHKVLPFVNSRGWEFDVYLDKNSEFKRAMNVIHVPHAFILDKNGKIVWQHTGFAPGDEEEIFEILKKLSEEE